MSASPVDQLAEALEVTEQLVAAVPDGLWPHPTPCADWTVRDLVNHLVQGNLLFADALSGRPTPSLAELRERQGADQLGDDPSAAYRDAAGALLEALRRPGVLEEMVTVPIGVVPGTVAAHLRIVETLVHGWDLAKATGQPLRFPRDLAEQELAFARTKLGDLPPGRTPFAPPQPVADDAPALDRLAACLGRRVDQPLADAAP